MSGEIPTGVGHYVLIVRAHCSELGAEWGIIEPYCEEACLSSTTPWTQSCMGNSEAESSAPRGGGEGLVLHRIVGTRVKHTKKKDPIGSKLL